MLTLLTLLLWISAGLGDDKPSDCKARDLAFCSSPCLYLMVRCNWNRECTEDLCEFLYPRLPSRDFERCLELFSDCTAESASPNKRGVLNKNVAYLLLKLHPYLNQTSQLGFLTSGRFRRITGNFGTEFLGKRSNNKSNGRNNENSAKPTSPSAFKFYSLPLNKLAKSKILKRDAGVQQPFFDPWEKRLSLRGNERVILGSEFLGKRSYDDRFKRLSGTEFLGKRNNDYFDGSELLGKRTMEADKRQQGPLVGTELLGKKSSQGYGGEFQMKRFGNELLRKRIAEKEIKDQGTNPEYGFRTDYDPKLIDEAFSSYESFQAPKFPLGSHFCPENESAICGRLKIK